VSENQKIADYELVYETKEGSQSLKGELFVTAVNNKTLVGELPPKVEIGLCVASAAEHDLLILDLLEKKNIDKAIAIQQEHLEKLQKLNARVHDENGFFKYTLQTAEESLEKMKKKIGPTQKKHRSMFNIQII